MNKRFHHSLRGLGDVAPLFAIVFLAVAAAIGILTALLIASIE